MKQLNIDQKLIVKKILVEYINKSLSYKSPRINEIEEIIKILEDDQSLQ